MKKNVINHQTASKKSFFETVRSFHLFPRLICLLLALVIWLVLYHAEENEKPSSEGENQTLISETL